MATTSVTLPAILTAPERLPATSLTCGSAPIERSIEGPADRAGDERPRDRDAHEYPHGARAHQHDPVAVP